MQIFKLLDSSYLPGDTIQNFDPESGDTLAWVERYQTAGDFKLEMKNEVAMLSKLPLGTLISHTDTTEVMIVENHEIDRKSDKSLKVTISGRSFETFAENRVTTGSGVALETGGVANVETTASLPSSTIARNLLRTGLQPGTATADDAIPNLLAYEVMQVLDTAMAYVVKRGDIYGRVLEFLKICDAGIMTIRPNGAQTTLDLVVHDGIDRSDSIIFYAQNEDLDDAKYFWSAKGEKNYAQIAAKIYARLYRDRNVATNQTGLNRKVMYVEASDLEANYTPPTASDVISSRGQTEIDNRLRISLLQAKISKFARPKFKFDYDVGDLVTVFGDFGVAQAMRVTEHILTVDKDGIRGYPSLNIL